MEIENEKLREFVAAHAKDDPAALMLKYSSEAEGFDVGLAVTQIECRRRTAAKLPSFLKNPHFFFPSKLASEQASDEAVARFHASLVGEDERCADLTGGLGIDAMTIAAKCRSMDAYELDSDKSAALRHNAAVMGLENMRVLPAGDSLRILAEGDDSYDVIFIDPARRDGADKRTYAFSDCTPDVTAAMPLIMSRCNRLIIKASPMLDITDCLRRLPNLARICSVARKGECKEVLTVVERDYSGSLLIEAVDILAHDSLVRHVAASEPVVDELVDFPLDAEPLYLYEPNAAVMKLGQLAALTRSFPGLKKCDRNTNLYLSRELFPDFPGRRLRVENVCRLSDKNLKTIAGEKINVVTRNFPLSPEQLRKRLKIKDGGDPRFLYGAKVAGKNLVLLADHLSR